MSVFPDDIAKTSAGAFTKLDVEMFHHETWKPVYFGVKGQGHEAQKQCHRVFLHSCECWLLLVFLSLETDAPFCGCACHILVKFVILVM